MSYLAISFAPVQGFIEKSRKLRDLYGASLILSHLSFKIVEAARSQNCKVISPGSISVQLGMPNRILLQGTWDDDSICTTFKEVWDNILHHCRNWICRNLRHRDYQWDEEWGYWKNHAWEIFSGRGNSIEAAMSTLEQNKLSRAWIAPNWIGESSSLTGTDAIAWPELGSKGIDPRTYPTHRDRQNIEYFYYELACKLEGKEPKPEGSKAATRDKEEFLRGFLDPNERLSIPELVKRLVTKETIAKRIEMVSLEDLAKRSDKSRSQAGFTEIVRRPSQEQKESDGQWTGWFMGDGDKMGDRLKELSRCTNCDDLLPEFSERMRNWGKAFQEGFEKRFGRVVYAGGDDFLGVLYHPDFAEDRQNNRVSGAGALNKMKEINQDWQGLHGQLWEDLGKVYDRPITLSLGLVWAAPGVPQRDVLQHCRQAEGEAKSSGRDRLAIRVLFNSGQYVQWTCPWKALHLLEDYRDRDQHPDRPLRDRQNWGHAYGDLAQLKARRAIDLIAGDRLDDGNKEVENQIDLASRLLQIYFNWSREQCDRLIEDEEYREQLTGQKSRMGAVRWIDGLIGIGWHLLRFQSPIIQSPVTSHQSPVLDN
ncbi:MAG: type III-B CRISPR-associated protein Cas10/Cmr2 [Cyanobacteria bacterium P01_E01_bin.42]